MIPIAILNIADILRIILGLPFILFIPGYVLLFALYPTKKTEEGIDVIERFALSFGISIVIVALIGFGLNYMPEGIQLGTSLLALFLFIIGFGSIALYRWFETTPDERYTISISLNLSLKKSESKVDKAFTIILAISIILATATFVYVLAAPKRVEQSTEFYLLGPTGKLMGYPRNLSVGEIATVSIGITNHEYRTINYTIEIWLTSQTIFYNESTKENETIYNHMWFMDKINIALDHKPIDTEGSREPQWEYNYNFNVTRNGDFKLVFLLFTKTTEDYSYDKDYKDIAELKINNAYRQNHLWINVK